MTFPCIEGDKFGYFPPCLATVIPFPTRDTAVSSESPVSMRVLALFALFGGGVSPFRNKSKRESVVYISINARDRMAAGLQQETAVSPLWWEKGAV